MDEKELYELKFFDYRPLDPDMATLIFMQEWAYRMRAYNEDLGRSQYYYTLKSFDGFSIAQLKNNRRFKVLTKLRQFADKHGLRYYDFWAWAVEAHLELKFQRTFENTFLNKNILARVLKSKKEREKELVISSSSKLFHADSYQNYPVQNDYYGYLVRQIRQRNPANANSVLTRMAGEKSIAPAYLKKFEGIEIKC